MLLFLPGNRNSQQALSDDVVRHRMKIITFIVRDRNSRFGSPLGEQQCNILTLKRAIFCLEGSF